MSRICGKENCENVVPKHFVDENGKKHNCQRRKFCFECSPFGQHNTRNLNHPKRNQHDCWVEYFNKRKIEVIEKVQSITGDKCWLCEYDKTWSNLCFHHVNREDKLFNLSTRELMLKWERIFAEMQKCVLVCMNCHGEIHAGLIPENDIKKLHKQRWKT
jgi:hypothetical protein